MLPVAYRTCNEASNASLGDDDSTDEDENGESEAEAEDDTMVDAIWRL